MGGDLSVPLKQAGIRELASENYDAVRATVNTGDLLFCSGTNLISRIIQRVSGSPYSHVALVVRMRSIDRLLLLEAEWPYGVRVVPLSSYLKDWNGSGKPYPGHLLIARHARLEHREEEISSIFLSELVDILGHPYSLRRLLRLGLREIAELAGLRFSKLRANKSTVCSEYVVHAYSRLGIQIPWNHKGTILPLDIAAHRDVSLVCRIQ